MSKAAQFIDVDFGDVPSQAGADLALALLNMMLEAMAAARYDTPDKRVQFWAGFLASMSGTVAADVGSDAAKAILSYLLDTAIDSVAATREATH